MVALGGAVGSMLRYLLACIWPATGCNSIPIGTLATNVPMWWVAFPLALWEHCFNARLAATNSFVCCYV